jgi:2,4-dienoyl-CoA reductase-like NADH-dependent reductase (Old Yellow Enzyme family)
MGLAITDALVLPNGQTVKNRLAKAAMTEGLADPSGRPSAELIALYRRWSAGGIGLMLTGNVQVDRQHLERAGNVTVDRAPDEAMRAQLAAWVQAGTSGGSAMWAQLSHAGRQTQLVINPAPKAPSAVPMPKNAVMKFGVPVAMTEADIRDVTARFVRAAEIARASGFHGVQVHGAHGYLLSSFLSPLANRRTDAWGGSLENRARLLLDIVRAIRASVGPEFGLSVKLNSADFQRGGFAIEDSVRVARWLDEAGIDLLEISGGNYEALRMAGVDGLEGTGAQAMTAAREAYFLEFAPRMRASLRRAKLMVTGGFRTAVAMNAALASGDVDLIGLARPLCAAPECPAELLAGTIDSLPRFEDRLRLGPGFLSARSPFKAIKTLNAGAAQAWYCEQIVRLGAGLEPERAGRLLRAASAYRKRDAQKAAALQG